MLVACHVDLKSGSNFLSICNNTSFTSSTVFLILITFLYSLPTSSVMRLSYPLTHLLGSSMLGTSTNTNRSGWISLTPLMGTMKLQAYSFSVLINIKQLIRHLTYVPKHHNQTSHTSSLSTLSLHIITTQFPPLFDLLIKIM